VQEESGLTKISTPSPSLTNLISCELTQAKLFWKGLKMPRDDLSSGLEFFRKSNKHNKVTILLAQYKNKPSHCLL